MMPQDDAFTAGRNQAAAPDLRQRAALLGEVVALLLHSPLHRAFTLDDVERWFLPPLALDQVRLYRRGAAPWGLATWAWLDDATLRDFLAGDALLEPNQWRCGAHLLVVDFVAPHGSTAAMVTDLRRNVFRHHDCWTTRRWPDGRLKRVVHYPAVDGEGRRAAPHGVRQHTPPPPEA